MRVSRVFALTASLSVTAGSAFAASITDQFTSFWVLGDSLSAFVGEPGEDTTLRASDAPLWSEQIILDFEDAGKTAESFAAGGATAGLDRDAPLDLGGQVDLLLGETAGFGDAPLVALWIGGNDIAAFQSGLDPATTFAAYTSALTDLISVGVTDFLLFEVPDVGFTSLLQDFTPPPANPDDPTAAELASEAAAGLNTLFFDIAVAALPDFVDVTLIETFELTRTAYEDPEFFGALATGPCVLPNIGQVADCSTNSFWDPFHPTGLIHSYVADEVKNAYLAPVPLPAAGWMLLAGLGGLAAFRRRG